MDLDWRLVIDQAPENLSHVWEQLLIQGWLPNDDTLLEAIAVWMAFISEN